MEETNSSSTEQEDDDEEDEEDEEDEDEDDEDEDEEKWAKHLDESQKQFIYSFWMEPLEIDLKHLLTKVTGKTDIGNITSATLKINSKTAGLHRLSYYTPRLRTLILDGSCIVSLRDLGSCLKALSFLSVNKCNLNGLDGVWGFCNLKVLLAQNNSITDPAPCAGIKKLETLDLSENKISDITTFVFLRACKRLKNIAVNANFFEDYEDDLKALLPQVQIIDDVEVERDEDSDNEMYSSQRKWHTSEVVAGSSSPIESESSGSDFEIPMLTSSNDNDDDLDHLDL